MQKWRRCLLVLWLRTGDVCVIGIWFVFFYSSEPWNFEILLTLWITIVSLYIEALCNNFWYYGGPVPSCSRESARGLVVVASGTVAVYIPYDEGRSFPGGIQNYGTLIKVFKRGWVSSPCMSTGCDFGNFNGGLLTWSINLILFSVMSSATQLFLATTAGQEPME